MSLDRDSSKGQEDRAAQSCPAPHWIQHQGEWSCPSLAAALRSMGPIPHWASTMELTLLAGTKASWPFRWECVRADLILICCVVVQKRERCPPSLTPCVWGKQESWPSPSPDAARGTACPAPHLGSSVELTICTGAWVRQPRECEVWEILSHPTSVLRWHGRGSVLSNKCELTRS